jgi:hypothetical protein
MKSVRLTLLSLAASPDAAFFVAPIVVAPIVVAPWARNDPEF